MRKISILLMTLVLAITSSCSTYTGNGALIGTGAGAAVGAGVGMLVSSKSDRAKGAAIGAGIGAAVGAGTGALIGRHMDKKKAALAAQLADQATVESYTDSNGLPGIKVTLNSGILFDTNKAVLKANAKSALSQFATQMKSSDMINAAIYAYGHTDSTGTDEINQPLSEKRAKAVTDYLKLQGIAASRLNSVGMGSTSPVADNGTAAGRSENRRVELYVLATDAMVEQYNTDSSL